MHYPEYPSFSRVEKRIQTFTTGWDYPAGTHLCNVSMATAGFINLGKGKVICFYCGNRICDFEPRYFKKFKKKTVILLSNLI